MRGWPRSRHLEPYSDDLDGEILEFYVDCLRTLQQQRVPFLVGGACALAHYAGVTRDTHDLDVFVRRPHAQPTLDALASAGYHTNLTFPHWLGKAMRGDGYVDVIFSSGNGIIDVDDAWFEHSVRGEVLGVAVDFCPPEEVLWSKCFIMERERFDGADVVHLLRAQGPTLDWHRVLARFGSMWRVLLGHVLFFSFVYPGERDRVPKWVTNELLDRARDELDVPVSSERLCQGSLLSRGQYLIDVDHWGYEDARLTPRGNMTPADVAWWTACMDRK
jgi:hypothetical protein